MILQFKFISIRGVPCEYNHIINDDATQTEISESLLRCAKIIEEMGNTDMEFDAYTFGTSL